MRELIVRTFQALLVAAAVAVASQHLLTNTHSAALTKVPVETGPSLHNPLASAAVGLAFGCSGPWSKGISLGEGRLICWDIAKNGVIRLEQRSASLPPRSAVP